jgi:hypothetical protein
MVDPVFNFIKAQRDSRDSAEQQAAAQMELAAALKAGDPVAAATAQRKLEEAQLAAMDSAINMKVAQEDLFIRIRDGRTPVEDAVTAIDELTTEYGLNAEAADWLKFMAYLAGEEFKKTAGKAQELKDKGPLIDFTVRADTSQAVRAFNDVATAIAGVITMGETATVNGYTGTWRGPGIDISGRAPGSFAGGPVSAGNARTVGEYGPELFIPNYSGQIIPNNKLNSTGTSAGRAQAQSPTVEHIHLHVDGRELTSVIRRRELALR